VGDAHSLPFDDCIFDAAFSHCVLMWVRDPATVVREMVRVVRPGGFVALLGEPDYDGRIDYPPEVSLREILIRAVKARGGDPCVGRKLKALLSGMGLRVEAGVHAVMPPDISMIIDFEESWAFAAKMFEGTAAPGEIEGLKARDEEAIRRGGRVILNPLFWALGKKP
jgi:SAM-dependent methyltransferase